MRTIFDAYVLLNDADVATADLRVMATSVAESRFRSVLASFVCAPDVHGRLAQIVEDVVASQDGAGASRVLAEHLRRIATMVRIAGASPVFVAYHVTQRSDEVVRHVATEHDVVFLEMSRSFRQRLAARRWEEVRAPDGHCNDEGYRLMAAIVADGLQDIVGAASR